LVGMCKPGVAYLTRRYEQFAFLLEVLERWKKLPESDRNHLFSTDTPWVFVKWVDAIEKSDRRPMRNAVLYFLFPDQIERILSNDHRRNIVDAFKHRLPESLRPKGSTPPLDELDRPIYEIRKS